MFVKANKVIKIKKNKIKQCSFIRVVIKCSLKYKTIGWIWLFFNFIIVNDNMTNVIINLFTLIVLKLMYLVLDIQYSMHSHFVGVEPISKCL